MKVLNVSNGDYKVTVPDLPGCSSFGLTVEDAVLNTKAAIKNHLKDSNPTLLSLFGDYCTDSTQVASYMNDSKYKDGLFIFVEVEL